MNITNTVISFHEQKHYRKSNRKRLSCLGIAFEFVIAAPHTYCFSLSVVLWWLYNNFLFYFVLIIPRLQSGALSFHDYPWMAVLIAAFSFASLMCFISLVRAAFTPPGVLEDGYGEILTEKKDRSWCDKCNRVRPRRTHHCSACDACIRQFDHHCWWINNCVGEDNKWLFVLLIFYTTLLTLLMFLVVCCYCLSGWHNLWEHTEERMSNSFFIRHELFFLMAQLPLTGYASVLSLNQFLQRIVFVRTDTTSFQKVVDPLFSSSLPPFQNTRYALSKLFGTDNALLWVLGPLRRYKPQPQVIYIYQGKEPNVL